MNLLFAFLLFFGLPAPESMPTDLRDQLSRKWLMIGFELNGKKYSEVWLERQRQNGLASVLEFQKNGGAKCISIARDQAEKTKRKQSRTSGNYRKTKHSL